MAQERIDEWVREADGKRCRAEQQRDPPGDSEKRGNKVTLDLVGNLKRIQKRATHDAQDEEAEDELDFLKARHMLSSVLLFENRCYTEAR